MTTTDNAAVKTLLKQRDAQLAILKNRHSVLSEQINTLTADMEELGFAIPESTVGAQSSAQLLERISHMEKTIA